MLGPFQTIAGTFIPVAVYLLFKFPEIVIIALLVLTSGLLPNSFNPSFSLGVGHFQLSDLMLISLLGITGIRLLVERKFRLRPTVLYLPLGLFCLAVIGGMITATVKNGVQFAYTTYEARILLYYSLFFAVINLLRAHQQAYRLIYGIFVTGILLATLIVMQIVLGFSIPILPPSYFRGNLLMRAFHPGLSVVLMTILAFLCILVFQKPRLQILVSWFVLLLMGLSIMVSLGRIFILSALFSVVILFLLLHARHRQRLIINLMELVLLGIIVFSLILTFAPSSVVLAYPKALLERFTHFLTTDYLSPEETALWRVQETHYAWGQILRSPLLGIGLKTQYRPAFFKGDTLRSYIHNGYLWLWLKTGLAGLISFLWFFIAFVTHSFRNWTYIHDEFLRAAALGFTLGIVAMMITNFVAPQLVSTFSVAFFAVAMGVVEAVLSMKQESHPVGARSRNVHM